MWFAPGGILARYRMSSALTIRQKFKSAENIAQSLWDGPAHQDDSTGARDESEPPVFKDVLLHPW